MSLWLWAATLLGAGALLWGGDARGRLRPPWRESRSAKAPERVVDLVRRQWRRGERRARHREGAAEFALALADELSGGLPLEVAVQRAGDGMPWCSHTLRAARMGSDIPAALRLDAADGDLSVLQSLAAAWLVASGSGAGLAVAARNLGIAAMQRERSRRELASEMAGPRATARVLALLPAVGLVLGSGFGGSPWTWLTATPLGLMVLVVGVALEVLGLLWVHWLVRRVEQRL